jgi:hypothetical protein
MPLIPKHNLQPPEPTMRQERTVQASIFDLFATHEIGLSVISTTLLQPIAPLLAHFADRERRFHAMVSNDFRRS